MRGGWRPPPVQTVLHPALPGCPAHELWKRDFTGSTRVFSIVLAEGATRGAVETFRPEAMATSMNSAVNAFGCGLTPAGASSAGLGGDADCRFSLAIRSVFRYGGLTYLNTGAGIMAESVPVNEFMETEQKLRAAVQALARVATA